jgi:hypothetical protein
MRRQSQQKWWEKLVARVERFLSQYLVDPRARSRAKRKARAQLKKVQKRLRRR